MPTFTTNPIKITDPGFPTATATFSDLAFLGTQTVSSTKRAQLIPFTLLGLATTTNVLQKASNLSDLADAIAARGNLGAKNLWYTSGTAAPGNAIGIVNDFAFNDNGVLYEKTAATTWTSRIDFVTQAELTAANYLTATAANLLYAPIGENAGPGLRYTYNTSTTFPATTGQILLSAATFAATTSISVHTSDRNSRDFTSVLDLGGNGSRLHLTFDGAEETYAWFNVTAIATSGSTRTYTVTHIQSNGTPANGEMLLQIVTVGGGGGGGGIRLERTFSNTTTGNPTSGTLRLASSNPQTTPATVKINDTRNVNSFLTAQGNLLDKIKIGNIIQITNIASGVYHVYQVTGISTAIVATTTTSYNFTCDWLFGTAGVSSFPNNAEVAFTWLPDNSSGGASSLTIETVDASVTGVPSKLVLPNGTLAIASGVATYTPSSSGGATSNGTLVASTLKTFGDSITFGVGASATAKNYANLMATDTGWALTNAAISGHETLDQADAIYATNPDATTQHTVMLGFNDLRNYGAGATGQNTFTDAIAAISAWLAIPATKRTKAQETSVITYAGTWANSTQWGGAFSRNSATAGATATFTFQGTGFLVGYTRLNTGTGTFSVAIDGGSAINVVGADAVASANGRNYGPAVKLFPNLNDGFHTAVITVVSGTVNLDWMAGIGIGSPAYTGPNVFLGNVIRMDNNAYPSTPQTTIDALIGTYNNIIKTAIQPLVDAGLKIRPVSTTQRFKLSDRHTDNIHPNDNGHAAIASAFVDIIRATPGILLNLGTGGANDPNILPNTFTAADGTTIIGKYATAGGNPWVKWIPTSTNGLIVGNRARQGVAGAGGLFAVRNVGLTSYTYTATFMVPTTFNFSNAIAFLIRCSTGAEEQGFLLQWVNNLARIYKATGPGAFTQIGTDFALTLAAATDHTTNIVVSQTAISWTINSTQVVSNLANTDYATNTGVGFTLQGDGCEIDNFSVS